MLLGGFVAVLASKLSLGYDSMYVESTDLWFGNFVVPPWSGSVVVVTALLVILLQQSMNWRHLPVVVAAVGSAVIASPSVVPIAANQAVTVTAIGSGLLLAASALVALASRLGQICFMTGIFAAVLFWGPIRQHLPIDEYRWMVTLGPSYVDAAVHPIILVLTAVVVVAAAIRRGPVTVEPDSRVAAVLVGLPSVYFVVYVFLGSKTSTTPLWLVAVIIACVATVVATHLLPYHDRVAVWFGFGVAAVSVSGLAWNTGSWWVVALGIAALIAGLGVGNWRQYRWLGFALLAGVTASALLTASATFEIVPTVAYAVVLPAAIGYSIALFSPVTAAVSVLGPAIPLSLALFSGSAPAPAPVFGWSNGAESMSHLPAVIAVSPLPIGVVVATLAILFAGVAATRQSASGDERAPVG